MSESGKTVAMGHGAVMSMTPGANLPAYVQAVSGIPILSVDRDKHWLKSYIMMAALTLRES